MMESPAVQKILFMSSYPPRKCGIASFTSDLVLAVDQHSARNWQLEVCALDKQRNVGLYNFPVTMCMDSMQLDDCLKTADTINKDDAIKLVCIEHEFGLYGGELGEFLLGFLSLLEKPFFIRFHTVLPKPSEKMLKVVQAIGLLAEHIIVMTENSLRILKEDYELLLNKIIIIPHGTHHHSNIAPGQLKIKYQLEDKQVLSTFGLLSPNKGIEKGILAMKGISATFPNAMYVVLGQTHPNLLEQEGEKYRNYLQDLIAENGLENNVRLINEFVPVKKLMEYLALTDIYLFTSKDPNQAVSGTFLYAMSAGCPIISTDFVLGREMLDKDTGVILATNDEKELADQVIHILENPALKKKMRANAFLKTKHFTWEHVGQQHVELFSNILETATDSNSLSGELTH